MLAMQNIFNSFMVFLPFMFYAAKFSVGKLCIISVWQDQTLIMHILSPDKNLSGDRKIIQDIYYLQNIQEDEDTNATQVFEI